MPSATNADRRGPREQPPVERERMAERIADHLDAPMTALGVIFLLVVLAETVTRPTGAMSTALVVTGWVLWAVFVAEFVVRLAVAPDRVVFLRRHWWQVVFLILPFLRFARALARLRVLRTGRVLSSAVRSTRTAGRNLSNRVAWLGAVTAIIILSASQIIYQFAPYETFADALHATTLATVAGEPLRVDGSGLVRIIEVALVLYSVIVFAALAGMVGAFFLERARQDTAIATDHRPAASPRAR